MTVMGRGLSAYAQEPWLDGGRLAWRAAPASSGDLDVLRPVAEPFSDHGGLRLLSGNLGRAIIKTSAMKHEHHVIEAPALVFNDQEEVIAAFQAGKLARDFVAVVRFQGPRANGMPELHAVDAVSRVSAEQGLSRGAGHRRPDVGCFGQRARCHSRDARSA